MRNLILSCACPEELTTRIKPIGMDKETINKLVKDKRLVKKSEFKADPEKLEEFGMTLPLLVHDPKGEPYYATLSYFDEIFKAFEVFITNEREYEVGNFYFQLRNRITLELPGAEHRKQFLLNELEILKGRIIQNAEMSLSIGFEEISYVLLYRFIHDHFEAWLLHWVNLNYFDFQHLQGVDMYSFNQSLSVLVYLDCVEVVKKELLLLEQSDTNTINIPHAAITQKLIWQGTPAHLAFIIDLLIEKGYLRQPTPFGERSAELLLNMFDFTEYNPTKESLGKLLHKDKFPINDITVIERFRRIPARNELKK